jgi:hypothetical protein
MNFKTYQDLMCHTITRLNANACALRIVLEPKSVVSGLIRCVAVGSLVFMARTVGIAADLEKFDPRWVRCQKSDECVIVDSSCGPLPANRKFAKSFERYEKALFRKQGCVYTFPPPKKDEVVAVCENNQCTYETKLKDGPKNGKVN